AGLGHIVGALREPLKGRRRLLLLLFAGLACLGALDAQLNEIAHRLLERRPILALVGGELQPGFQCGDARIGKGGNISSAQAVPLVGARATVAEPAVAAKTVLRISE